MFNLFRSSVSAVRGVGSAMRRFPKVIDDLGLRDLPLQVARSP